MLASAFMTIVVPKVAGVETVVACAPPRGDGIHPAMLHAMASSGADAILCLGGVQALAALAYGIEDLPGADMIVGAGNAYVAEAKRQLFGEVGIDVLAGPTEILVIADESADPRLVAVDLLGQAEHGPTSPAMLVTTSRQLGAEVLEAIDELAPAWPTGEVAGKAWSEHGTVVVVDSHDEAIALADRMAPEHLEVQVAEHKLGRYLAELHNYGSLFLGREATVAYGDKAVGTNHVLPTMGARALHRRPLGRQVPQDLHLPTAHRRGHSPRGPGRGGDLARRALRRPRPHGRAAAGGGDVVRLTVGQAIVRWLQAQHSERDGRRQRAIPAAFGIFGHGNALGLGQAFVQEGGGLPLHQPKNEQAMVHAAIGYAKASRRLATLACTASIGPGATNMLTGAATATVNRLPVLLLPADTFANRRQGPVLQQLEHPLEADASVNEAFRPLSRFFDRVARPEQLLTALPAAMRVLLDPAETGAVTVAIHQDVLGEAFDYPEAFFAERTWRVPRRPPAPDEVEAAAVLLRGASRPLVIAGGGVRHSEAEAELCRLAEELGLPVAETSAGKGSMPGGHELNLGGLGVNGTRAANSLAADADVVVCVGTRLTDFTTGSHSLFQDPRVAFVGVNVCAADAYKLGATPVVADARLALEALRERSAGGGARNGRREQAVDATVAWRETMAEHLADRGDVLTQAEVYAKLNACVEPGDWVVAAAGYAPGDLLKAWTVVPGSSAHIEFGFSCMGHEIPAGLGIRMHEGPAGEVFVVIGDGTYLMGASELVTSIQDRLKLTVVVLDNGGYQSIHGLASSSTGVSAGNEFRARNGDDPLLAGPRLEVDFAANAESFGCAAFRADDLGSLEAALSAARTQDRSAVIVCRTAPDRPLPPSGAFWDLGVPEAALDERTTELAADHRRTGAARQRAL